MPTSRHREESCRDGHQYAVKSSTADRTITHRHTPLGETVPALRQIEYRLLLARTKVLTAILAVVAMHVRNESTQTIHAQFSTSY